MFVITKNRTKVRMIDAINEIVSESISERSIRSLAKIFRRGRYGKRLVLEGRYLDYMRDREKEKRCRMYKVGVER